MNHCGFTGLECLFTQIGNVILLILLLVRNDLVLNPKERGLFQKKDEKLNVRVVVLCYVRSIIHTKHGTSHHFTLVC